MCIFYYNRKLVNSDSKPIISTFDPITEVGNGTALMAISIDMEYFLEVIIKFELYGSCILLISWSE